MKNKKETKLMDPLLLSKRNAQLLLDAELSYKQMGEFVLTLLRYQDRGTLPQKIDPAVLALWKAIRADMKREFGEGVR